MKISIITVCLNSEKHIEDAIKSVISQDYENVEYIIVDGMSSDKTLSIIQNYRKHVSKIISEIDNGIYDAMNKGIRIATGEIIGILNSDDFYANESILTSVVNLFKEKDKDCVYGDIVFINETNTRILRKWVSGNQESILSGWHPPHPAFFVKKSIYDKYGSFNENFKVAGDFEFFVRFFEIHNCSSSYLEKILVKMRTGGESTKSIKNIKRGKLEIKNAFKIHNLKIPAGYFISRYLKKAYQFLYKGNHNN